MPAVTKKDPRRGRPRLFNIEQALDSGEALFHEHGYDAVSVATLTEVCGITSTSFYAAFGSKANFFKRVLMRYEEQTLSLEHLQKKTDSVAELLKTFLVQAVYLYARSSGPKGCLVLASLHLKKQSEGYIAAQYVVAQRRAKLSALLEERHLLNVQQLVDFISFTLMGLSACAREGWDVSQLEEVAYTASCAVQTMVKKASSQC